MAALVEEQTPTGKQLRPLSRPSIGFNTKVVKQEQNLVITIVERTSRLLPFGLEKITHRKRVRHSHGARGEVAAAPSLPRCAMHMRHAGGWLHRWIDLRPVS
jgi:hypothetical protein